MTCSQTSTYRGITSFHCSSTHHFTIMGNSRILSTHFFWMWQNASQIDQARSGKRQEGERMTSGQKSTGYNKGKATQNENACSPLLIHGHHRLFHSPPFPPSIWYDAVAVPQQNPSGNVRVFMSKAGTKNCEL